MPKFGNGRPAVVGLMIAAAAFALAAVQQPGGPTVVSATETDTAANSQAFQPLTTAAAAEPAGLSMNAAVSVGQFEELTQPTPRPTVAPAPTAAATLVPAALAAVAPAAVPDVFETGVASTYGEGDGFEGNLTACGQVFRTAIIQVAHKTLPCGTMIRVEDADTGTSVVAEVTDRGPYIPGRIVDLSWGAFRQLDANAPGLLHVNLYLIEP